MYCLNAKLFRKQHINDHKVSLFKFKSMINPRDFNKFLRKYIKTRKSFCTRASLKTTNDSFYSDSFLLIPVFKESS